MFNFFIIMDENLGNTIARHFSSEYLNYTINFIISKEFPSFSDFPDFSLVLCDLDQNIELAKKYNLPAIAFSHENTTMMEADLMQPYVTEARHTLLTSRLQQSVVMMYPHGEPRCSVKHPVHGKFMEYV